MSTGACCTYQPCLELNFVFPAAASTNLLCILLAGGLAKPKAFRESKPRHTVAKQHRGKKNVNMRIVVSYLLIMVGSTSHGRFLHSAICSLRNA
jgi:hypothetical protein